MNANGRDAVEGERMMQERGRNGWRQGPGRWRPSLWSECASHPKFTCWNPAVQGDGIGRCGFGKVLRSQGWSPHEWDHYSFKRDPTGLSGPFHVAGYSKLATQKRALTRFQTCWNPDLRPPAPGMVSNTFVLFLSRPGCGWVF